MKLKLPENFGGCSVDGQPVELEVDADGVVNAEEGVAQALLQHGATVVEDPPVETGEEPAPKRGKK